MKTLSAVLTRRDRCYLFGRRAARLTPRESIEAWQRLAQKIEALGSKDVPKFNDLLIAFRAATVMARRIRRKQEQAERAENSASSASSCSNPV